MNRVAKISAGAWVLGSTKDANAIAALIEAEEGK
jgi:hypothetical protein